MGTDSVTQFLEKLIDDNFIQACLDSRRPPQCPADWNTGFMGRAFGKDVPWGDLNLSWKLLRTGKIYEGRELLRRLCKHHPMDKDNLALGAFELQRPPEDSTESTRLLEELYRLYPDSSELRAIFAFEIFRKPHKASHKAFYQQVFKNPGKSSGSAFSSFLDVLKNVFIFDVQIQAIFGKDGQDIVVSTNAINNGAELFKLRKNRDALAVFASGYRETKQIADSYERRLGWVLTHVQREAIVAIIQISCLQGLHLTLFDLGLDDLARRGEDLADNEKQRLSDVISRGLS